MGRTCGGLGRWKGRTCGRRVVEEVYQHGGEKELPRHLDELGEVVLDFEPVRTGLGRWNRELVPNLIEAGMTNVACHKLHAARRHHCTLVAWLRVLVDRQLRDRREAVELAHRRDDQAPTLQIRARAHGDYGRT